MNGTYENIVAHLETEIEVNSLEAIDETQMNTVTNNKLKATKIMPEISTVTQLTLTPTTTKMTDSLELSTLPVRKVARRTTPQRDVMLEPMHQTGHLAGRADRDDRLDLENRTHNT